MLERKSSVIFALIIRRSPEYQNTTSSFVHFTLGFIRAE
jgi:hypothetical protein